MIQAEVYDRIDLIYKMPQHHQDKLNDHVINLLYDELEILCEVIADEKLKSAI